MQKFTRSQMSAVIAATVTANNLSSAEDVQNFAVEPAQAQKIVAAIKPESSFLEKINMVTVVNQHGEVIGLNATGLIAKRTNTKEKDREARETHSLEANQYLCRKVEFDTAILYDTLDAWAHNPKFKALVVGQTRKQIALNLIMIGWYGEKYEAVTDPEKNALGEDVTEGWLSKIKTYHTKAKSGKYITTDATIGKDGTHPNLDSLVADLYGNIETEYRGDLIVIIGSDLLADGKVRFYDANGSKPSEKSKVEDKQVIGTYGGLPAYEVPFFPETGVLITSFDNLSIYTQRDSVRRKMIDNPKRDRYENFYSMNIDYIIEDYNKVAYWDAENIKCGSGDSEEATA